MNETIRALTELFKEAGKAHHAAFIETDGDDPDWPIWYASYLINHIGPLLGTWFSHQALSEELAELANDHQQSAPGIAWPEYYAKHFVRKYEPIKETDDDKSNR